MRFIDEKGIDLEGKKALVRVGFDVPFLKEPTTNDLQPTTYTIGELWRIKAGLPTIQFLLERGARIILLNHIDRPEGRVVPELSNGPVAKKLAELLGEEIPFVSLDAKYQIENTRHSILMLENLRFLPGEEAGDLAFAKELASLGDLYINDAFSNSHRAHASMVTLPSLLPSYGGLLLKKEIEILDGVRTHPLRPLVLIIGGLKIETKLEVITFFWDKSDAIILGGALANTLLHAQGIAVGKSVIDPRELKDIKDLSLTAGKLYLPCDVKVATNLEGTKGVRIAPVGRLKEDEIILDIGPDSEALFDNVIKSAKMVIWNGPLGKFENPAFMEGTLALAESILRAGAKAIIGGGETIEFLDSHGLLEKFPFVSTGGGAMLEYLAGEELPGLEALSGQVQSSKFKVQS